MSHSNPPNPQPTTDELIAAEVRAELGRKELSYAALARETGIAESSLRLRLKARVPFRVSELETVAGVLHVPVEQFLRGAA